MGLSIGTVLDFLTNRDGDRAKLLDVGKNLLRLLAAGATIARTSPDSAKRLIEAFEIGLAAARDHVRDDRVEDIFTAGSDIFRALGGLAEHVTDDPGDEAALHGFADALAARIAELDAERS